MWKRASWAVVTSRLAAYAYAYAHAYAERWCVFSLNALDVKHIWIGGDDGVLLSPTGGE